MALSPELARASPASGTLPTQPSARPVSHASRAARRATGRKPAESSVLERPGRGFRFFPGVGASSEWTVSRVLFRLRLPLAGEDHSSRRRVATPLEHSHPDAAHRERRDRAGHPRQHPYSSLLREGLASPPVTRLSRVGSYPTISPLPVRTTKTPLAIGGVISVALSLESPRVGVTDLPTLRSPDFPPADDACPPAILRPPPARRGC